MSHFEDHSLREELEVRVIALLTGELDEAEADELEKILAIDATLSAFRDRMAALMGELHQAREEIAAPADAPPRRLSAERRAKLFEGIEPEALAPRKEKREVSWKWRLFEIAAVICVLFVLAGILMPSVGAVKKQSSEAKARSEARQSELMRQSVEFEAPVAEESDSMGERDLRPQFSPSEKPGQIRRELASIDSKLEELQSVPWDHVPQEYTELSKKKKTLEKGLELRGNLQLANGSLLGPDVGGSVQNIDQLELSWSGLEGRTSSSDSAHASGMYVAGQSQAFGTAAGADALYATKDEAQADGYAMAGPVDPFAAPPAPSPKRQPRVISITAGTPQDFVVRDESGDLAYEGSYEDRAPVDAFAPATSSRAIGLQRTENLGKEESELAFASVSQSWERPKVIQMPDTDAAYDRVMDSPVAESYSLSTQTQRIVIPKVQFNGMPLSRVLETLSELSVEYDPSHEGVRIDYKPVDGKDPLVNIALRNLNLDRILKFVTSQVDYEYLEEASGIRVQAKGNSEAERIASARSRLVRQTPKTERLTRDEPASTFALNISDVSFRLAQAALESGRVPDAAFIRTEEFVNSLDYRDPAPRPDEPVSLHWEIAQHPYAHDRQIIRFSLQTQSAGRAPSQPLNLSLLIDNSGSMQRPDRQAILEKGLQSLNAKLTDQDRLSVVLFARQPKLIAEAGTRESQQAAVNEALAYRPEGGTNLEAGLEAAYASAQRNYNPTASNRVILMTDGAANLGNVDSGELAGLVVAQRKQGIALDAYGIGWDDYNDALLEEITRNGDGRYAFLNSVDDAARDFSEKLAGTLRVAAADVKVQVVWNPERVTRYRQIGYDLHQLREEDFRDNTVDAAEVGEAESGTALYVVQIKDEPGIVGGLGTLYVRYRDPASGEYREYKWQLPYPREVPSMDVAPPSIRLAAASALFAERLANNPYGRGYGYDDLYKLTAGLPEAFPSQRRVVDLQNMILRAQTIYGENN
ncbi:YfbK domain-containing protein [Coraliomargarita parva]|uniref:YfbK domain-containing protein n=1 Tax=Coraliomargarita parva TaxID=3014050 RepID=UPI0022B56C27|nr:von Willebrand factor type A domain-containing protein [Coraliomargarita parva]